jgi:hypothetical protein
VRHVVLAEYANTPQNEFPPFPLMTGAAHSPGFYDQVGFGTPPPPFSQQTHAWVS